MTLEQTYYISQIAAAVLLIASILFLAAQVRQNSRMIERIMTEDHNLSWRWTYQQVAQSREFAAFHRQIGDDYDKLDEVDKYRAEWLAQMNLRGIRRHVRHNNPCLLRASRYLVSVGVL